MIGQQEVLVGAGEAEFEVSERTSGAIKGPDSHQEQHDVRGHEAGHVLRVLERLHKETGI